MIDYRTLTADEINLALFEHFRRRQTVTKCWRKSGENGASKTFRSSTIGRRKNTNCSFPAYKIPFGRAVWSRARFQTGGSKALFPSRGNDSAAAGNTSIYPLSMYRKSCGAKGSAKSFSGGLKSGRKNAAGRNYTFRRIRRWKVRRSTARWVVRKPRNIARRTWKKNRATVSWNAFCKEKLFISDICPKDRREVFLPRFTGAGMR